MAQIYTSLKIVRKLQVKNQQLEEEEKLEYVHYAENVDITCELVSKMIPTKLRLGKQEGSEKMYAHAPTV